MHKSQAVHFPNLNGLRFIAAFMVIIYHIEQFKFIFGVNPNWETSSAVLHSMGGLGVLLFFTLSGFLITYLLLEEEQVNLKIDIKQFYIRRILRIWPLYFLIFIMAFFILRYIPFFTLPGYDQNKFGDSTTFLLFVFFLSNIFLAFYGMLPYASQTWSVAVEEQFYLIWPLILFKVFRNKMVGILSVVGFIVGVRLVLMSGLLRHFNYSANLRTFWNLFNIDCMAIGAIMSLLLFKKSFFLKYLVNIPIFIVALLFLITVVAFNINIPLISIYFNNDLLAGLFAIIILNLASNKALKNLLEFKWFNYLGKISYGLYMFHSIAIVISLKLLLACNAFNNFTMIITTLFLTILISHISYSYFEAPFLKLKNKFSRLN